MTVATSDGAAHTYPSGVVDELLRTSLQASFLSRLPPDALAPLVEGATQVDVPAGVRICAQDGTPAVRLVASGLLRISILAPDGRSLTQRYVRRGDVGGIPAVFANHAGGQCHALVDSVLFQFRTESWREAASRDARVASALLEEVSHILMSSIANLANEALWSMRSRVVRHLLDIAADRQNGAELLAPVTQQQLAEGVGSAREVVARVLRGLRDERLVATGLRGIVILDPERLQSELSAAS